jgi:hypothetical protein
LKRVGKGNQLKGANEPPFFDECGLVAETVLIFFMEKWTKCFDFNHHNQIKLLEKKNQYQKRHRASAQRNNKARSRSIDEQGREENEYNQRE